MDGVEVSVMAWSSTSVDVSHMQPFLVSEEQSRVNKKSVGWIVFATNRTNTPDRNNVSFTAQKKESARIHRL